jgi:phosphoribosylanthranilate isomerase
MAVEAGADALGFVFYEKSPRFVNPLTAAAIIRELPPLVQTVGLFVNEDVEKINWAADFCGLDLVQLHGDEEPRDADEVKRRVIRALRVKDETSLVAHDAWQVSALLLDAWVSGAYGGTGETFNWDLAAVAARQRPVILAGGLTPENVAEAVRIVHPYAVDVSSGVEATPGRKDPEKVREFVRRAKGL